MQTGRMLTDMGYLPINMPSEGVERDLVFDMWNQLEGEQRGGVLTGNLKKMLMAITGIHGDLHTGSNATEFDVDGNIEIPRS